MSEATYPIYEAQVGALGSVAFFRDPESNTYCFMFHNGMDYTPLYLSDDAAYYVWMFIGCEHPDCEDGTPMRKMDIPKSMLKPKGATCKPATKKKKTTTRKKAKAK